MWKVNTLPGLLIHITDPQNVVIFGPVSNNTANRWTLKAICDYHDLGYLTTDWLAGRTVDQLFDTFHQLEAGVAN